MVMFSLGVAIFTLYHAIWGKAPLGWFLVFHEIVGEN